MMKFNKFLTILSVITLSIVVASCVEDDDFNTPEAEAITIDPVALGLGELATFDDVIARHTDATDVNNDGTIDQNELNNADNIVGVYNENDTAQYIVGYVVSSDKGGNFFEELVIQNTPGGEDIDSTNPRLGLNVQINVRSLSDAFDFGRKVFIRLNGLAIGIENGVYTLGKANGNSLEQLQEFEYLNYLYRDAEIATVTPKIVESTTDLTEADENTFVQLNNMQVHRSQVELTYAGEVSDQFDGFRTLESCDAMGGSIMLQTSTFADFKQLPLPQFKGSIKAVFTRDFGDDTNVLVINSTNDLMFDDPERCDPIVLDCTTPSGGGSTIFSENFESFGTYDTEGWSNINISGTSTDWFISDFNGNSYSRISAFNSDNSEANVWLVTPAIDLDNTTGEELSFDVEAAYDNGTILSVYISTDYTGDPTTATWQQLDADIPVGPSSGFGGFDSVGPINISCLDGNVHVGFLYEGSDPGATTRYHVDNIVVSGN